MTTELLTSGAIAVLQILQALGVWAYAQREVHLRIPRARVREQSQAHLRRKPREFTMADIDRLTDHITRFSLGGIEAIRKGIAKRRA